MSHTILIKALEYVATSTQATHDTHYIFTLITTQRQLFNSLAPILPKERKFIPNRCGRFFRLLMRADTFRFATSLYVISGMNKQLAQQALSRMDCVITVEFESLLSDALDDVATTLMALPYLERVVVPSSYRFEVTSAMYNRTLRPLLHHPRESVRRGVAASGSLNWFRHLSSDDFVSAVRDDFIPLIDTASCNAVIFDYLQLLHAASSHRWSELPRDVIIMLGDRLFQFFTSSNAHSDLIDKSLRLLVGLVSSTIRQSDPDDGTTLELLVDVFKTWPVLEELPDVIRQGVLKLNGAGLESVIYAIFQGSELMRHHQQLFFEMQIADVMYDAHFARTGASPFDDLRQGFFYIASASPVSFLARTNVIRKEVQNFLLPWHDDHVEVATKAAAVLPQRRAERVVGSQQEEFNLASFNRSTAGAHFITKDLLGPVLERRDANETSQVLRMLFDDTNGKLSIAPILRSYVRVAQNPRLNRNESFLSRCRTAAEAERHDCVQQKGDGADEGEATVRCYLSEFLASLQA